MLTGTHPVKYENGSLSVVPGARIEADAVVSLPRLEGRHIEGLPYDSEGFIPVDDHARIPGLAHAYAVGDVTNFPVKQGGIATQQADVAAEAIALELGCDVEANPLDPVLRGILWTGIEAPLPVRLARRRPRRNLGRQRASALADRQPEQADRSLPDALPGPTGSGHPPRFFFSRRLRPRLFGVPPRGTKVTVSFTRRLP